MAGPVTGKYEENDYIMRLYYTLYIKSILIDGIHGKSILIDGNPWELNPGTQLKQIANEIFECSLNSNKFVN